MGVKKYQGFPLRFILKDRHTSPPSMIFVLQGIHIHFVQGMHDLFLQGMHNHFYWYVYSFLGYAYRLLFLIFFYRVCISTVRIITCCSITGRKLQCQEQQQLVNNLRRNWIQNKLSWLPDTSVIERERERDREGDRWHRIMYQFLSHSLWYTTQSKTSFKRNSTVTWTVHSHLIFKFQSSHTNITCPPILKRAAFENPWTQAKICWRAFFRFHHSACLEFAACQFAKFPPPAQEFKVRLKAFLFRLVYVHAWVVCARAMTFLYGNICAV